MYKKLWRDVENAGDRKDQVNALMAVWIVASQAFIKKAEEMRARAGIFLRRLEFWRDDLLPVYNGQPFVIPEDRQRAKKYFWGAVFVLAVESVVGTLIAYKNGWHPVSGTFIAVSMGMILDAAFLLVCWRVKRPRAALDKLRRYFLHPSLIVLGLALPIFFLGRMSRGAMAVSLVYLITVSLWVGTLSLLVLGATLLACAYLYNWTHRDRAEFDDVIDIQTALRVTLDKALRELAARGVNPNPLLDRLRQDLQAHNLQGSGITQPGAPSKHPSLVNNAAATMVKLLPALVLAVIMSNASCTQSGSNLPISAPAGSSPAKESNLPMTPVDLSLEVPPETGSGRDMIIGIDGTGSPHKEAVKLLVNGFRKEAPRIIASQGIQTLKAWEFNENGRVPRLRADIELPKFTRPQFSKEDAGDAGIMPNIEEGINENNKNYENQKLRASLTEYVGNINKSLTELTEDKLMPSSAAQAPCTDLNGFLSFLSTLSGDRPRTALLFTDGAENCAEEIESISLPRDLTLIIMLLPLSPEETHDQNGLDANYKQRLKKVAEAVPGATVVAYNADIYKTIIDAEKKSQNQNIAPSAVR